LAFYILGECSKVSLKVLDTLLVISHGADVAVDSARSDVSGKLKFAIQTWPFELTCVYVEVLTGVCLNAPNSLIKRKALLGQAKDAYEILKSKQSSMTTKSTWACGLLELATFGASKIAASKDDLSWHLRYMAIKGLVQICKLLNDKENEELRQTCWCSLTVLEETEKNEHVLEALKVGQVKSKIEKTNNHKGVGVVDKKPSPLSGLNIYSQIAVKLDALLARDDERPRADELSMSSTKRNDKATANRLLADLHLDQSFKFEDIPYGSMGNNEGHSLATTANPANRMKNSNSRSSSQNGNEQTKKRTTLQDEITLSNQYQIKIPNYYNRKNFDLMRIVEDQVREKGCRFR
jgi:hypothetical protein